MGIGGVDIRIGIGGTTLLFHIFRFIPRVIPGAVRQLMRRIVCSSEQEAKYLGLWGVVKPEVSEELVSGSAGKLWDCPAGYSTVGVQMMQKMGRWWCTICASR